MFYDTLNSDNFFVKNHKMIKPKCPKIIDNSIFTNADNLKFYNGLDKDTFNKYLLLAGLECNADLEVITPHMILANNILIVGASYGRELEFIRNLGLSAAVTAIEISQISYLYLKRHFSDYATIINDDILVAQFDKQFDCILLLFGLIYEFSPQQIQKLFTNLALNLAKEGVIFIDSMITVQKTDRFIFNEDDYFELSHNNAIVHCQLPSRVFLKKAAVQVGLRMEYEVPYTSGNNINRVLYQLCR